MPLAAAFLIRPEIDIAVSQLFFVADQRFVLRGMWIDHLFDQYTKPVGLVLIGLFLGLYPIPLFKRPTGRDILFVLSGFVLGVVVIVNGALKGLMGRARPHQTESFGGTAEFTVACIPADQCAGNCSFVSGDVAFACAFLSMALLTPVRMRGWCVALVMVLTVVIGAARIMRGSHYLSDVLFAALIMIALVFQMHRLFYRSPDTV
ncbi:MAG: phosphatase PAP2 family protein [Pseudomonadota bacterium]|nr:phosphatase PAP2 family protein [Pseudomonadota bacterium]